MRADFMDEKMMTSVREIMSRWIQNVIAYVKQYIIAWKYMKTVPRSSRLIT